MIALIEALISRGARSIIAPACPVCGRTLPLRFKHGGLRCCRRCYAIGLRRTCGSCGEVGDIASRTPDGDPVCDRCTKADPANHETCGECGRRALCRPRQDGTRLCRSCHTEPVALCSRCGKSKPCYRSATASPICPSCSRSKAPCVRCGNVRLIAYRADDGGALCQACGETTEPCSTCGRDSRVITRTPDGPICRNCYRADIRFVRECRTCGTVEHLYHDRLCNRCAAIRWLRDLFADPEGAIRADLEGIVKALTAGRPLPLLNLLERTSKRHQLRRLREAGSGLDHHFLDQLGTSRDVASLRAALVAAGLLPPRDEYLITFETWLTKIVNQVEERDDEKLIRSFGTWSVLRQLRRAAARRPLSYGQVAPPRTQIRSAIRFLSWVRDHDRTLPTCTQADLDAWLTSDGPGRPESRRFISWATKQHYLKDVIFPSPDRSGRGQSAIEDDERWSIVHRLLHDDSLDTRVRVAGCLVLLYGQTVSRIAPLTGDQIIDDPGQMRLQLGIRPVDVPAPLADLLRELATADHHAAVLGETGHRWLFPGQYANQHMHPASLNQLLNAVGAHSRPGRSTALMDLASQLPPVVVSKLLGLHISTATEWAQAAGNTRPGYAASVARRRR
ncbi:hypothetical protein MTP10_28195 [Nonomuraea sp. 3-1Str]|uniref:hypothetical protein n=1 Tax=Nonomuraea sp. 3-1Str TaxID=2929801 RepID=UPI002866EA58|nr:hypothetical protein [Nonomuraea sp. 3-1Str]MDR8412597.1 hypothetical protein [Nonomuraea sp. 3-1Str]